MENLTYGIIAAMKEEREEIKKIMNNIQEQQIYELIFFKGKIKNSDVANELALPPVKVHCSVLAEEAVNKAIEDYKAKNKGE